MSYWSKRRARKRAESIVVELANHASNTVVDGHAFQFSLDMLRGDDDLRMIISTVTQSIGEHVRAHVSDGVAIIYLDDGSYADDSIVVATMVNK